MTTARETEVSLMKPWIARVLFYGGTLLVVVLMCQDAARDLCVAVLGDRTGDDLYAFIRTNVEAPISVIALAIYLDVVLARRTRADLPAATADEREGALV